MQWYVSEQIEEEGLARKILDKLALAGDDHGALYLFDRDILNFQATRLLNESSMMDASSQRCQFPANACSRHGSVQEGKCLLEWDFLA